MGHAHKTLSHVNALKQPHLKTVLLALQIACVWLGLAAAAHADDRENTDVITLKNGDRITGEIKSLQYGILEFSTSNMGTLKIEFPAVLTILSTYTFHVERLGGERYFGTIATTAEGSQLTIRDGAKIDDLPIAEVTRMSQLDKGFWQRLDGNFSVGYNFTKSSDISVSSLSLNTIYRERTIETAVGLSMHTTKSPEAGTQDRHQLASTVRFLRPHRNFWIALGSLERNEELGIEARLQAGGALARHIVQRTDTEATGFIGLSFNQEWVTGAESAQQSLEGVLGADWRIFRFADPETSLTSSLILIRA